MFHITHLHACEMLDENNISSLFTMVWQRLMAERDHDGVSYSVVRKSMIDINIYLNDAFCEMVESSARSLGCKKY